jgi:hypothetical protein
VGTGNQEGDWTALVLVADVDVAESTQIANGDSTAAVELVPTDSVLDGWGEQNRACFESGLEGLERSDLQWESTMS